MIWRLRQEVALQLLPPDVAGFVRGAMSALERENVVDAPGVIHNVVRQMRLADSAAIRSAIPRTEQLLKWALVPPLRRRGA